MTKKAIDLSHSTGGRALFIFVLLLMIAVPMKMIRGLIHERSGHYQEAQDNISAGWADMQIISDPVLILPYRYEDSQIVRDTVSGTERAVTETRQATLYIQPERTQATVKISSELRQRGLFAIPIYQAHIVMEGMFTLQELAAMVPEAHRKGLTPQRPYLALGVEDPRGIYGDFSISWAEEAYEAAPGAQLDAFKGVHVPLPAGRTAAGDIPYAVALNVKGTRKFSFMPMGRQTDLKMEADWAHPSFGGMFLPIEHDVRTDGFTGRWAVGTLATDMGTKLAACNDKAQQDCAGFRATVMSVDFMQGLDIYARLLRAVKYGMLFVGLTFAAFFAYEMQRQYALHIVQYFMVGAALALFYVLLLALAEHIGFGMAYLLAMAAICGLLGYYITNITRNRRAGLFFGGGIATLYAALYMILRSEDYALLMGAGLLFVLLALAMVGTRKVNWDGAQNTVGPSDSLSSGS